MKRRSFLQALLGAPGLKLVAAEESHHMKPRYKNGCCYCGCLSRDLLVIPMKIYRLPQMGEDIIAAERIICPSCLMKLLDRQYRMEEIK